MSQVTVQILVGDTLSPREEVYKKFEEQMPEVSATCLDRTWAILTANRREAGKIAIIMAITTVFGLILHGCLGDATSSSFAAVTGATALGAFVATIILTYELKRYGEKKIGVEELVN